MSKMKFISIGCGLLAAGAAEAATTPNSVVTPQIPNRGVVQFLQGTDNVGTYKTLYTGGTNGSRCYGMLMNNNDTSTTHLITVQIVNATVKYGGTALATTLDAGFANSSTAQPLMSSSIGQGFRSISMATRIYSLYLAILSKPRSGRR